MEILNQLFVAGALWNWIESLADYSAVDYDLKIDLKRQDQATTTLTATVSDVTDFEFTVTALVTATYNPGYYSYHAYVINKLTPTEIISIEVGIIEVKKDLSSVADSQVFALSMVEKYRAVLLLLAEQNFQAISVDDKSVTAKDERRIQSLLDYWESKAGLKSGGGIKRRLIKFVND